MRADASDLIAGFYEAAFDAGRFPEAVSQLGDFARACGAGLLVWDARAAEPALLVTAGMGADAAEAYCRHYAPLDPYRPLIQALPTGAWSTCSAFFDDRFVARDPFYNEYLIPRGTRYVAAARVVDGDDFQAYVGIHRGPRDRPVGDSELQRLEQVGRQIGRALTLYLAVTRARLGDQTMAAPLERLARPALLVDATRRVLYANPAAEALLAGRDGVDTERGRLRAGSDTDRLERLIAGAIGDRVGGELRLARSGGTPRVVTVMPSGPVATLYGLAPVPVALLVFDAPPALPLQARFGLTRAETTLAQGLADGKRLTEVAAARRVSIETVRTQLRALFRKTGARRQPDLVRILLAVRDKPGED